MAPQSFPHRGCWPDRKALANPKSAEMSLFGALYYDEWCGEWSLDSGTGTCDMDMDASMSSGIIASAKSV